ncbi:PREDICTED: uncharacterized protein LOC104799928 isoform X2 [Tarenaya hassleriana]|uniref:uncharacterized protein LOC104799928 isoform X2 n=1 Tax=Tarenaya hassleriana TaxID=28532 RepID=UPI00053C7B22|nr:PREDICTED: uncharacterized protein LOC104799928 isoform X2 [Tarenaya hassleriana]
MAAKRRKKKRQTSKVSNRGDETPSLFRSLALAIASSQVSQKLVLKSLQYLLVHLSLNQPTCWDQCDAISHSLSNGEEVKLKFEDVHFLSDVLFTELNKRYEQPFSTLCKNNEEPSVTHMNPQESIEEATLLLRCCMNTMRLLISNQEVALEKAKALLAILRRLISAEPRAWNGDKSFVFTRSVSCGYTKNDDGPGTSIAGDFVSSMYFSGPSDPCHSFLCTGLEVFADEILVNKTIRDLLLLVDSAFSSNRLFSTHSFGWFGLASVLEVISSHFVLSFSDEKMTKVFIDRLYLKHLNEFRTSQISLSAAISLLRNPVMLSAPRIFHAYVVLLVKDAIGINVSSCVKGLDLQLIGWYLHAFESSVVLYTRHMCNFDKGGNGIGGSASSGKPRVSESNTQVAFEYLLLPSTLEKVNYVMMKLNDSWDSYLSNIFNRKKTELVASSFAYAKESVYVFGDSCSEVMLSQILSILGCLILRACSDDVMDFVLQKGYETSTQDLYLLGSSLKLMSCSMLQAILCLKDGRNRLSSKATEGFQAEKEYKAMMDIVQRFEQFSVSLPSQRFLHDTMERDVLRHVKSKWMLIHFSGLLSMSYAHKLDFLMKDSIFAMVVSLYLFILEEGDLHALRGSIGGSESSPSVSPGGFSNLVAFDKTIETEKRSRQLHRNSRKFELCIWERSLGQNLETLMSQKMQRMMNKKWALRLGWRRKAAMGRDILGV